MIVNFWSSSHSNQYKIDTVTFPENKKWELSLVNFIAVFRNPITHTGIYELSTNMIERDDGNIPRTICYIFLESDSSNVNFTPTQKLHYKLRFHDLSATVFKFRSLATSEIIYFSEVAFQIEIRETYGRF